MTEVVEFGAQQRAWFNPNSDSTIKSVRFKYYGGDTSGAYIYTVRSCAFECDSVLELTPGASASFPAVASVTLPPVVIENPLQGPASVSLQVECVQGFCPDPPELVAKDFEFTYDDSEAPLVTNVVTEPADALAESDGPDPNWVRGESFKLAYQLSDHGAGVAASYVQVDTNTPQGVLSTPTCWWPYGARMCDAGAGVDAPIDLRGLADGEHSLTLTAVDGTSPSDESTGIPNSLQKTYKFFLDNGDPNEPTGLAFSDAVTRWNWTPEAELVVSHDDAMLDPKNTEHSGFGDATFDLRESSNAAPALEQTEVDPAGPSALIFPHEGLWDVGVRYKDSAGNVGNRAHRSVGFDADSPERPDPIPREWISLDDLHSGVDQAWTPPPNDSKLESGICAYAFAVDDDLLGIPAPNPDVLAPTTSERIPSGIGEGNHFAHVRSIACNGKPSLTETVPVNVDGSAPLATLHGVSSSAWLTSPPNVSLSATDALSGVAAIEFGFDGPGALTLIPGTSAPITVPQGAHTITYRAIDIAGNVSPLVERPVNADWTAPTAEFAPRDPTRPNRLTARIDDAASGLAGAGMQIRRADSGGSALDSNWKELGEFETIAEAGAKTRTISRSIPDGGLIDGAYEVRVVARDVAGNWIESGPSVALTLPLRSKPALSAAIALVGKESKTNWSGASGDRVVLFGKRAALVGSLLDANRNPITGARIAVTTTPQFGIPGAPQTVVTDARGEFVMRLPQGPTRRFDLHFDGDDRLQPIDQSADIRVRAALEFSASPKRVRSNHRFRLRGRLLSASMGLPDGRKVVQIEFLLRNKWVPTIATPLTDTRGRFSVPWEGVDSRGKSKTVYFRVRAQRDGTWPFLSGSSKPFAVRVTP